MSNELTILIGAFGFLATVIVTWIAVGKVYSTKMDSARMEGIKEGNLESTLKNIQDTINNLASLIENQIILINYNKEEIVGIKHRLDNNGEAIKSALETLKKHSEKIEKLEEN